MRPHGSGERSGDERHGPGTDRGVEEQVDRRAARHVARAVRPASHRSSAGATWRTGSPFGFRNCTSAASPTGPGASSTPWPTSSSPRRRAGAIPGRPIAGTRLRREWKGVEHVVTVREHDFEYDGRPYRSLSAVARADRQIEMERLGVLWPSSQRDRPDDLAASQDPLRDLLPQEHRGRT